MKSGQMNILCLTKWKNHEKVSSLVSRRSSDELSTQSFLSHSLSPKALEGGKKLNKGNQMKATCKIVRENA